MRGSRGEHQPRGAVTEELLGTIPLAARWADQWNFPDYTSDIDLFRSCLRRLDEVCEEIGRDRDQIEVSVQFRYPGDPSETVERVAAYRESGAGHAGEFLPSHEQRSPSDGCRGAGCMTPKG